MFSTLRRSLALAVLALPVLTGAAQAQGAPFPYDRCGQLINGIQCVSFGDELGDGWTVVNNSGTTIPLFTTVRLIGTATPGFDINCAAANAGELVVTDVLACPDSVGDSYCFGDGGDQMGCTDCPCGNNAPVGSEGGCVNGAGSSATLFSEGSDSLGAADLCFRMTDANPSTFAALVSGAAAAPANPANPCFGLDSGIQSVTSDGLRCAVQDILRHGTRPTDVNGDTGIMTNPWGNCSATFPNGAGFASGQTRYFQSFYREFDTAVCQTGQNTTQAIAVTYTP